MMSVVVLGETVVVPAGLCLIPYLVMKHVVLRIWIGCEWEGRRFAELVATLQSFVEELGMGVGTGMGVFGIVKGLESESSLV